ncbi:hypothetical protein MUK42_10308 [Musa troglodytarum]|uniref:Uncharacterized protein n=1 Tax=Musa troglodytarum TaxID=320322 RepID=A0A9E7E8L2_9LILI|nr:hypothetical protein MUK42_10308 [Musa troglodytarum]
MTASAMVTDVAISTEAFLDRPAALSAFCRLGSRISLGRDLIAADKAGEPADVGPDGEDSGGDFVDFEFRLNHPVAMLPADELFANGKLVPLQLAATKPVSMHSVAEICSPEQPKSLRGAQVSGSDPYVFSPRAPSCTSRWRELLGLKRAAITKADPENVSPAPAAAKSNNPNPDTRSLRHFFHRNHKSSPLEPSLSLPLLRDSDSESVSISARLSLSSSSSSGPDHEDLPRFSLDSDKPNHHIPIVRPLPAASELGRSRTRRTGSSEMATPPPLTVPVDSSRMNPSGNVVFHGLERSSSSPESFTAAGDGAVLLGHRHPGRPGPQRPSMLPPRLRKVQPGLRVRPAVLAAEEGEGRTGRIRGSDRWRWEDQEREGIEFVELGANPASSSSRVVPVPVQIYPSLVLISAFLFLPSEFPSPKSLHDDSPVNICLAPPFSSVVLRFM